jgi:hypothetical protein
VVLDLRQLSGDLEPPGVMGGDQVVVHHMIVSWPRIHAIRAHIAQLYGSWLGPVLGPTVLGRRALEGAVDDLLGQDPDLDVPVL